MINCKIWLLPALLHDQTPSHLIRHEKIQWFMYPECQNQTIFKDFRPWNLKFALQNLQDFDFSACNLILSHFLCSYMIKHHLIWSGMKKYIDWGTLNVKVRPFSRILGLEPYSKPKSRNRVNFECKLECARPKILENGPILTFRVPKAIMFFMPDRMRLCLIM